LSAAAADAVLDGVLRRGLLESADRAMTGTIS
jgi:hypothetical protein